MFEDKIALVTGGSTGIGAAAALELAKHGAKVLITGRHEATLKESAARHPNLSYLVADIGKEPGRAIEEIKKLHRGRLDVLVNNAGIAEMTPLADATLEHVRRTFDTNVFGLVEITRFALPLLRQTKGNIVNVASVVADEPFPNMSIYSASKAAVLALTRAWAQELGADGVRVNAVSPGPIDTPIFDPSKTGLSAKQLEELGASILQRVPLARFGKAEEVARVIAFLASDRAAFVTGAQWTIGGGIEA